MFNRRHTKAGTKKNVLNYGNLDVKLLYFSREYLKYDILIVGTYIPNLILKINDKPIKLLFFIIIMIINDLFSYILLYIIIM